jgi:arabinofuranan 3-O-arabinosyltransferase
VTAPAGTTGRIDANRSRSRGARWADRLGVVVPALLAYVPLLFTQVGQVGADTKTYLYLDPGRLLSDAPYLWDSGIGAGTITHQNIGYLWPMGPFYWLLDTVGVPDWTAQRLWLGTVMFVAAMGVRYLLRTLGWRDWGVLVASLAYMLSPYLLDYSARISVILLPWAGLGWLIAFTIKSIRHGGWRWPAWFALTVLTVGGINATALLMIAPGPALWFVWAVWVEREASLRQAAAALGRLAALTLVTSLWWMAGLWAQGRYGLPVLRYTESYQTVAEASTAPEVLRGLGYWFFYGRDKLGPWIEPNVEYTSRTLLLGLSYAIPALAVAGAALTRWRHRSFFLALVVVGALMSIGAHPWDNSSPLGWVFKMFTRTDAGLALRSTPRALPLVVLGLSVALGAGVSALGRRIPRLAVPSAALIGLLVVVNLPPLWNGTMIADNLKRPEDVPTYWTDAAEYLQAGDHQSRVLEVPGTEFASYRWGNTVDPITPGLIDRPYVARELFAYGTPASQGLLIALDRRFHEDSVDPDALAPIARLLSAGDVVLRSDLQFERYRTARPRPTWELLRDIPGLGNPEAFGAAEPNVADPEQPLVDEVTLALPLDLEDPPPVAVFPVENPLSIIRAEAAAEPLTMAGGPEGVVDAAGIGVLDRGQPLFYSATFGDDPDGLDRLLADGADLLVTDTNRKQARRWGALQQNTGYTERADERPEYDPTDNRLAVFPDAPPSAYTVSEQRGDAIVTATDYGNPVTYTADDRPANALDGDPETAWRVGAFSDVRGERLIIEFDEPVTTDHVRLLQPTTGIVNRVITSGRFHFDGEAGDDFGLTPESEDAPGQTITFAERTFQRLEIEVLETNIGRRIRYDGVSAVGFAEVDVAGVRIEELIRPPTDLLDAAGADSLDHRLAYLFTRLRSNPSEPVRLDEEVAMRRILDLPTERSFSLDAAARLSAYPPDDLVDELLGLPGAADGGVTATSDARLPGSPANRASAALDGDPATFWSPPFEKQPGHWIDVTLPETATIDHLDLELLADGRHSVPTRLFLRPDGDDTDVTVVDLPPIEDRAEPNATVAQRVEFEPITARTLRVAVDGVRDVETIDWHSGLDIVMPIGIAELGIPGVEVGRPTDAFDSGCRDDLLTIDDRPIPVRVTGTTTDVIDLEPLDVEVCEQEDGTTAITLPAGEHVLRTGIGRDLGLDLDQLLLSSARGGAPAVPAAGDAPRPGSPTVDVTDEGRVSATVHITDADEPYWLVLGQSHSDGWTATVDGGRSLGTPTLIDGYANGWRIDPAEDGTDITVKLTWAPQRVIWAGLGASAVGVAACLVLLVVGRRREHPHAVPATDPPLMGWPPFATPGVAFSRPAALAAAGGLALFAALNSPPLPLLVPIVALVGYAAFRWTRGRALQAWVAAGTLAATGLYYVASQIRYRHPPDFIWPQQFGPVHVLGLLVIFLLAGECVRAALVTRKGQTGPTIEEGEHGSAGPGGDRPDGFPTDASGLDEDPT